MIIHKNITDTIGQIGVCIANLDGLKEDLGNPKKINSLTYQNNIEAYKNQSFFHFHQYLVTRKAYNHDVVRIKTKLINLEQDFVNEFSSLSGESPKDQLVLLVGILSKIQKLIVGQIEDNPTYYLQLKRNFPNSFK